MVSICSIIIIPCRRYVAAIFGVLYGSAFHIADNAADIISTFNVQTVINKLRVFALITDSRIYGMAN